MLLRLLQDTRTAVAVLGLGLVAIALSVIAVPKTRRAAARAERVQEIHNDEPGRAPGPEPGAGPGPEPGAGPGSEPGLEPGAGPGVVPPQGLVELRGVEFRCSGTGLPVLQNIDLVAGPGEIVAVTGAAGSGKSTLLQLIRRLFDAREGQVLINGVNVRDLAPGRLAEIVGYVPQKAFLFGGTIGANLRYGRLDATDAELWHALDIAQGTGFVAGLLQGLETEIPEGGAGLPDGHRQRLAIARALVQRPEIYLFDDVFASLDHITDAALRAALAAETEDATVIIAARRIGTIRHADRIVVLDRGRIAGIGTHDELMAENGVYRRAAQSQLGERQAK
ncbi:ABC transporter ATP-binding protein [Spirillospora sp. NPDC046719]